MKAILTYDSCHEKIDLFKASAAVKKALRTVLGSKLTPGTLFWDYFVGTLGKVKLLYVIFIFTCLRLSKQK